MRPHARVLVPLGLACLLAAAATRTGTRSNDEPRWWRGNTHTHTLWSDGDESPDVVASWYREHGYDFLVLSDHNVLSRGERWFPVDPNGRLTPARLAALKAARGDRVHTRTVDGREELRLPTLEELRAEFEAPDAFLFLEGEEITDGFEGRPVHVNGVNLAEPIEPRGGASWLETAQNDIDAVVAQGERLHRPTLAHLNHPNFQWALHGVEELAALRGDRFFEIYNGHPGTHDAGDADHPGTEELWDRANVLRRTQLDLPLLYGLATDDAHHYHARSSQLANAGRGWIVVRAPHLEAGALITAMRAGDFYASSGVALDDVRRDKDGRFVVDIAAEPGVTYTTRFLGAVPSAVGTDGAWDLKILAATTDDPAVYAPEGHELFVRAVVTSSRPHPYPQFEGELERAWTQPQAP